MPRSSQFLSTRIYDESSGQYVWADVEYDYQDLGVNMRRNEKMTFVIQSVLVDGREVLEELDEMVVQDLTDKAAGHWEDLKDLWRIGGNDL